MNTILIDQVIEQLQSDPWIGSHELLQRCAAAKTGEQVTDALQLLRKKERAQCRSGKTGLIWALAGLEPPIESTAPTPHKAEPYRSFPINPQRRPLPDPAMELRTEPEPALVSPAPTSTPPRRTTAQCNQLVLDALAAGPLSRKALREATGLCPSPLHAVLIRLGVADKIINRDGLYTLAEVPIQTPSILIETPAQLDVASNTESEPFGTCVQADESSFKCARWSTGELELHTGDVDLVLPPELTRVLIDYLDRTLLPGEVA